MKNKYVIGLGGQGKEVTNESHVSFKQKVKPVHSTAMSD